MNFKILFGVGIILAVVYGIITIIKRNAFIDLFVSLFVLFSIIGLVRLYGYVKTEAS
jgi:hypothetical protein